jgi:NAD(P)-dependent dehydrogenase (short-subunit alcohol dehydrogenase family)
MSQPILVTGSADGLGLATASELLADGYPVIGHARNPARAEQLRAQLPGLVHVVVADFASLEQVRTMAVELADLGPMQAVIHNAAVGYREPRRIQTIDGHADVLQVNVLAPYLLTALLPTPLRLVWLSSGLHRDGKASVEDIDWTRRAWNGFQAYADSKLFDATLAVALARRWPQVLSNALEPGWVPTKMGGSGAPDDLSLAHVTQVWLAEGVDPKAQVSGRYYYHQAPAPTHYAVEDRAFHTDLLDACHRLTGVRLPG